MIRIIHSADWHLGDSFHGFERDDEHRHFLAWMLRQLEEQRPDALLLSGDIYDNPNPSAQAERLFYGFLADAIRQQPKLQIIIIAGNHDSSYRLEAPKPLLSKFGVKIFGVIPKTKDNEPDWKALLVPIRNQENQDEVEAVVMALPYMRQEEFWPGETVSDAHRRIITDLKKEAERAYGPHLKKILMAHLYANGSEVNETEHSERIIVGGQEAVNCSGLGDGIAYGALGHIHKAQGLRSEDQLRYSGSILPMSFAEQNYSHGVNLVTIEEGKDTLLERLEYAPLRKLLSIPQDETGDYDQVMRELKKLPSGNRKEGADDWPYLEIRVKVTHVDPNMVGSIMHLLEEKRCRLCRILRVRQNGDAPEPSAQISSVEDLQRLNAAQLARSVYSNLYGEAMPDEIAKLFAQAKRQAEQQEDEA